MTFPATSLTHREQIAISTCNFETHILALQQTGEGPRVVQFSRAEVTCWQLFLRFLGYGPLANVNVRLKEVVGHLNRYDWKVLEDTELCRSCYSKVCVLANKAIHKRACGLYENVSSVQRRVKIPLSPPINLNMLWNPELRVGDLTTWVFHQIERARDCEVVGRHVAVMALEEGLLHMKDTYLLKQVNANHRLTQAEFLISLVVVD